MTPRHELLAGKVAAVLVTAVATRCSDAWPAAAVTPERSRIRAMAGGPSQPAAIGPRIWAEASAPVPSELCSPWDSPTVGIVAVPTMTRRA